MSHASKLKIALIQTPIFWEKPQKNRDYLENKIKNISTEVDLIIFPEMFTTGFTMKPKNIDKEEGPVTLKWMQLIAKQKKTALVGSIPFLKKGKYYNRLFFVKPNGEYNTYNKRHTFTLAGEGEIYASGNEKLIVSYKGFKICPLICYDLRFPVWARNIENYDILLYVANWPKARIAAWDILLKARAIENMSYCIGVNRVGTDILNYEYSGHSAIYNALGEQLVFSTKEEILYATLEKEHIDKTRDHLKFLDDKDVFTL